MGEKKSCFNFQFVLGWMLFNIYSTDHILKNMLLKPKKYLGGNFLFQLSLEQVNVGGRGGGGPICLIDSVWTPAGG